MDLLRQLKIFVAVADERHFGRAAGRLGMAQPPVSQSLQRLERDLGVVLFERSSRGVWLTPAGSDLLPRARSLVAGAEELRDVAHAHRAGGPGLRIGVVPQLSASLTAGLAASARAVLGRGSTAAVRITTAPTPQLADDVAAGRLDLAVVWHPALLGTLDAGRVVGLPTVALTPAGHVDVGVEGPVPLRALAGLPVAMPPRAHGPAAHDLLVDTLEERGLPVDPLPAEDDRAALALVAAGQAVTFTADPRLAGPRVRRIPVAGPPLPLRLRLTWRDPARSAAADALTSVLVDAADRGRAGPPGPETAP